jgi:hypothetical protein
MDGGSAVEGFLDAIACGDGGFGLALPADIEACGGDAEGDEAVGGGLGAAF